MKSKINVLHITARADVGGGPSHILTLLVDLPLSIRNYVACPNQEPYWDLFSSAVSDRTFMLPTRRFEVCAFIKLIKYCLDNKIQLIHTHGKGGGLYGRLCAIAIGVALVHTPHGIHVGGRSRIIDYFYRLYERITQKYIRKLIFVSGSERSRALAANVFSDKDSVVIFNGVRDPINCVFVGRSRDTLRIAHGFLPGDLIFITVTRIATEKNIPLTLKLAKEFPYLKFLIVGDGPQRTMYEEMLKVLEVDNVYFVGESRAVYDYYSMADIFISTSLMEGLPLSLLEAMSCKLPIIASKVPGHIDCVDHNVTGYLFDLTDFSEMCDYVSDLINDGSKRESFGLAGYVLYKNKFTTESMVSCIQNVYHNLVYDDCFLNN